MKDGGGHMTGMDLDLHYSLIPQVQTLSYSELPQIRITIICHLLCVPLKLLYSKNWHFVKHVLLWPFNQRQSLSLKHSLIIFTSCNCFCLFILQTSLIITIFSVFFCGGGGLRLPCIGWNLVYKMWKQFWMYLKNLFTFISFSHRWEYLW